ncbi:hypothetical protein KY329_03725 [Candidatus Woesearchaeota archaeon]|nr:hypothetical protein [Candidatus Woesearchaeota archaeon]
MTFTNVLDKIVTPLCAAQKQFNVSEKDAKKTITAVIKYLDRNLGLKGDENSIMTNLKYRLSKALEVAGDESKKKFKTAITHFIAALVEQGIEYKEKVEELAEARQSL